MAGVYLHVDAPFPLDTDLAIKAIKAVRLQMQKRFGEQRVRLPQCTVRQQADPATCQLRYVLHWWIKCS